eukprot:SAG31_NODE_17917_length_653_cov_1.379061_1_plen_38_part_10
MQRLSALLSQLQAPPAPPPAAVAAASATHGAELRAGII